MHGSLPSLPPSSPLSLPSFLRSSRCRRRVTFNGTDGRTSNQKAITCQHRIASIGLLERGWREGGRPWRGRWRPCIPVSYPLPSLSLSSDDDDDQIVLCLLSFPPSFLPSFRRLSLLILPSPFSFPNQRHLTALARVQRQREDGRGGGGGREGRR